MSIVQSMLILATSMGWPQVAMAEPVGAQEGRRRVIVKALAENDAQQVVLTKVEVEGEDGEKQTYEVVTDQVVGHRARNIEAGGPWLGIQFGPVSKPLTSQLGIADGQGQMVLNVASGSPADVAGMQQYDVITQVDGAPVASDIHAFLDQVRGFAPNELHTFTMLRGGRQLTVSVNVGMRPGDLSEQSYKYKSPVEAHEDVGRLFGRFNLLEKDDDGNWTLHGHQLKDLPDVWAAIPQLQEFDFKVDAAGPGNNLFVMKSQGHTLRIHRDESGSVTVTKTTVEDGKENTTTTTYDSEDEFRAAHPDLKVHWAGDDGFALDFSKGFKFDFAQDGKSSLGVFMPKLHDKEWREKLHQAMKYADNIDSEAIHKAMENVHRQMEAAGVGLGSDYLFIGKPATRFETDESGAIKVITRGGDAELVQTFTGPEVLRAARPELYEKYERLQSAADEQTP